MDYAFILVFISLLIFFYKVCYFMSTNVKWSVHLLTLTAKKKQKLKIDTK